MSYQSQLLPNLTHDEVTFMDRLDNIKQMAEQLETSPHPQLVNEHFIESFRTAIIAMLNPEYQTLGREVIKWYDTNTDVLSISHNIICAYVGDDGQQETPFLNNIDDLIDVIKYYNTNIFNNSIDASFLSWVGTNIINVKFITLDFGNYFIGVCPYYYIRTQVLLDKLSPRLFSSISSAINNIPLMGTTWNIGLTYKQRFEYIDALKGLVTNCPVNQILFLQNTILVEFSKLETMLLHEDYIIEDIPKHYQSQFGKSYINTIYNIIYKYLTVGISSEFYDDIIDILDYNNLKENDSGNVIPLEDPGEWLVSPNLDIISYIKTVARTRTINNIIN